MRNSWFRHFIWLRPVIQPLLGKQIQIFPIWHRVSGYGPGSFGRDSLAALNVALLAFPQGMAFALIAGLPLSYGIQAAIIASIVGALFSGSRFLIFGPTNATAILILSTFLSLGMPYAERAAAMPILLLAVGAILIVGSWFRLAHLSQYVSSSVTIGYITAAAILITANQLKYILGINHTETALFFQTLYETGRHLKEIQWPAIAVSVLTATCFVILSRRFRALPNAAISLVFGTVSALLLARFGYTVDTIGELPHRVVPASLVTMNIEWFSRMARPALAVAILSFLETADTGKILSAQGGERFDSNQHLFAMGMASLVSAAIPGMPVSASRTRSGVNRMSQAATPMAAVYSGLLCLVLFFTLDPIISHIPAAALASLVIVIAIRLIDPRRIRVILKSTVADAAVFIATFVGCLLFPLDAALYLGAGLSIIFFLRKVGVPELTEYSFTPEGHLAEIEQQKERPEPDISIVHVEGDLFFGAAGIFLDQGRRIFSDPNLKVIILRMKNAHHLDATCAMAIEELLRFAREKERHVIVSGAHRQIYRVFRNSGLLKKLGRDNFFMEVPSNPTVSTRNALRRAQDLLGRQSANIRIYVDPAKAHAPSES